MGFDVSQITAGFDLSRVLSDDKHYASFVCGICTNLVSLDAVVTSRCSHPFCRRCLEGWALECNLRQVDCQCPLCKGDLSTRSSPAVDSMEFGTVGVAARPLQEAQPLAHRVLALVQVACCDDSHHACKWTGDYGKFLQHASRRSDNNNNKNEKDIIVKSAQQLGDLLAGAADAGAADDNRRTRGDEAPETPKRCSSGSQDILNAREALTQQRVGADDDEDSYDPASLDNDTFDADYDDNGTEESNNPASPRPKPKEINNNNNKAAIPSLAKELERKSHLALQQSTAQQQRDAPPNLVKRKKSGLPMPLSRDAPPPTTAVERNNLRRVLSDQDMDLYSDADGHDEESDGSTDAENTYIDVPRSYGKRHKDWNMSINSMAFCDQSDPYSLGIGDNDTTCNEEEDDEITMIDLNLEPEDEETLTSPEVKTKQIVDRTEKLKKQANAKFNKGDFSAARELYTEGINVMSSFNPARESEKQLMAHMHSNRGVTFFRDKDYDKCVDDCKKALEYDPNYDKSWIRLWRAHMARGEFHVAHEVLVTATRTLPQSQRIQEELARSSQEAVLIKSIRSLMEERNFQKAKEVLDDIIKGSSNLTLICLAARANACLGLASLALDQVGKAVRLNPRHPESLEVQGLAFFLKGETERGAHILYDAYRLDDASDTIKESLTRCQKTHAALSSAKSAMKKGRYEEATGHFSVAFKESEPLPKEAPLYTILRVERAKSWLGQAKYLDALKDCHEVFAVNKEHVEAWVLRSEVLVGLDRAEEAKRELAKIRRSWGAGDPDLDEAYKKVDFEMRVLKANDDLMSFVEQLEAGTCHRFDDGSVPDSNSLRISRSSAVRSASLNGKTLMEKASMDDMYDSDHDSYTQSSEVSRANMSRTSARRPSLAGVDSRGRIGKKGSEETPDRRRHRADDGASDKRPSQTSKRRPSLGVERRLRVRKPHEDSQNAAGGVDRRPRTRKHHEDMASVIGEQRKSRLRSKQDDGESLGEQRKSRPRKPNDEEMSVGGERKSRQHRPQHDDENERKARPRSSKHLDTDGSVSPERRRPRKQTDDSMSVGVERRRRLVPDDSRRSHRLVKTTPKSPITPNRPKVVRRELEDDKSKRLKDKRSPAGTAGKATGDRRPSDNKSQK